MPNHCFRTPSTTNSIEQEWTVQFNTDVTDVTNYEATDFDSEEKTTEKLCDIHRTSHKAMLARSKYDLLSSTYIATVAAIAISGGNIYNALDIENRDAVEFEA